MASYKLIQDVEAEDHILGPLTLRQFLYGLGAAFFYYLCFIAIAKHILLLLLFVLPPALFATFFAFPFGRDQPTEVWALAKIRFLFKPKRRIWSQSGVKDLVTITVPPKLEKILTNGLSSSEVQNRLQALAMTIDSRGWAVKNMATMPNVNLSLPSSSDDDDSDRLVTAGAIPKPVPSYDATPYDDILEEGGPLSRKFSDRIEQSAKAHHSALINSLSKLRGGMGDTSVVKTPSVDESALSADLKSRTLNSGMSTARMHAIPSTPPQHLTPVATNPHPPIADQGNPSTTLQAEHVQPATAHNNPAPPLAATPQDTIDPAILNLAQNNDRSIASLAHEADEEVVIKIR